MKKKAFRLVLVTLLTAEVMWSPFIYAQARPLLEYRGVTVPSVSSGDAFGNKFAGAGDVNSDGYPDLITNGKLLTPSGSPNPGQAMLFLGSPAGLDPTPAWVGLPGPQNSLLFGDNVQGIGDVNNDGYDDVMVNDPGIAYPLPDPLNAPFGTYQRSDGSVYLYLGGPQGLGSTWVWSAAQPESHFGVSMSAAGDVDGDGYDDVLVGTPGYRSHPSTYGPDCREEVVYLYKGTAMGLEPQPAWVQRPSIPFGCFGFSMDSAGDVNNDGYDDVIISAFAQRRDDTHQGRTYVYYGSPTGLAQTPSWEPNFPQDIRQSVAFGDSVAGVGDIDGDGYDDVLIRVYAYYQEVAESRYYLYRGSATGLNPDYDRAIKGPGSRLYVNIMGRHDIDGDGRPDIIIGKDDTLTLFRVFHGQTAPPYFGQKKAYNPSEADLRTYLWNWTVAFPGDLDQDGHADVVVASPMGLTVLFGGPNPPPQVVAQTLTTPKGIALEVTLEASDLHDDPLTLSLDSTPTHGRLDASQLLSQRVVTYQPDPDFVGLDEFEYTATDPYGNTSRALIQIQVESTNAPPEFDQDSLESIQATVGARIDLQVSATDPDGDVLTYSVSPELEGAQIDASSGEFSWVPRTSQLGLYTLDFLVSDGEAQDSVTAVVEVTAAQPDRDGDGVTDAEDACPDEKGDVTRAGCPVMDMDDALDMPEDMMTSPDLNTDEDMGGDMERDSGFVSADMNRVDLGDSDTQEGGCGGCTSTSPSPGSPFAFLGVLIMGWCRRRQRSTLP